VETAEVPPRPWPWPWNSSSRRAANDTVTAPSCGPSHGGRGTDSGALRVP
jgi:hypothetical protein